MGQLYSLENGILVPYTMASTLQRIDSLRSDATGNAVVSADNTVAINQALSTQDSSTAEPAVNIAPSSTVEPKAQQSNVEQTKAAPQGEDKAYQQLYLQAMARVAELEKSVGEMQTTIARNAIVGRQTELSEADLEVAMDKFFGFED